MTITLVDIQLWRDTPFTPQMLLQSRGLENTPLRKKGSMSSCIAWKRWNEGHTCSSFQMHVKVIELGKRSGVNTSNDKDSKTLRSTDCLLFCGSIPQVASAPSTPSVPASYLTQRYLLVHFFPAVRTTHAWFSSFCSSRMYLKKQTKPKQTGWIFSFPFLFIFRPFL